MTERDDNIRAMAREMIFLAKSRLRRNQDRWIWIITPSAFQRLLSELDMGRDDELQIGARLYGIPLVVTSGKDPTTPGLQLVERLA